MIIMTIAELSGRCRQSPIVLGGEGQSLGTKDTLSIGPLDIHWSHVIVNPVRYTPVLFSLLLLFLLFVNPKNSKKQKQNNNNSSCKSLQQGAQKCDRFWFIHILLCRFNPIRIHLETVLNFWLVNVCVKECELIKGDHTFKLLAVMNLNRN